MVSRKISISIPEDLLKRLDSLCRRLGVSRSEFITRVLEEKLGFMVEVGEYPSVLWKLKVSGYLRLRSPRFVGRRVKCRWVIEEVSE